MMRSTHYLKSWSSTQKNVTLSSAESELLAAVKASGEALGMLQLMSSVGVLMTASIMVDSSAALALGATGRRRRGPEVPQGERRENPSDACTKHLAGERLRKLVARVGQCQRSGRAQESLRVQPARTAPADSPRCLKHQGEEECQHISTPSTGLSPGCDPVAVYCAKTLARLQRAYQITTSKVYVFSDSVLCIGEVGGDQNVAWMSKIEWYSQNNHFKELNRIDGMQTEFEWKIFPAFTTLGILKEIPNLLKSFQCEPEHFNGRIIFMSMYNDIVW